MNPEFIKPRYDQGGFVGILDRINAAFKWGKYDAVVLFLIDGIGWLFFERFQDAPFIKSIAKHGRIEKLISQFPSTTAAHLTSIHTGWNVGQSGVYEWFYYEPQLDALIAPLLFSFAGDTRRNTLRPTGIDPHALYPNRTLYQDLREQGVASLIFQHQDYTPSPYSDVVFAGATVA